MPSQSRPRLSPVLVRVLAIGLTLTIAGCSHATPAPVDHAVTVAPSTNAVTPAQVQFVLKAVRGQPAPGGGACAAGSAILSGGAGRCYRPLGTPMTIASAGVGPVIPDALHSQGLDGFWIVLPPADVATLKTVTTTAADAHANLAISVAGRSWLLPIPGRPFTNGQLEIFLPRLDNSLPTRNTQVLDLHRLLIQPS